MAVLRSAAAVICRNYSVAHIPIRRDATAIRSADIRVNLRNEDTPKHRLVVPKRPAVLLTN